MEYPAPEPVVENRERNVGHETPPTDEINDRTGGAEMRSRWHVSLVAALAVLVIGVGGAVAYPGGQGDKQKAQGKKDKQLKKLRPSRLSEVAYLTGQAEIDPVDGRPDAGDPDAKGSANLLFVDESTVCYGFMLKGADAPTNVHIHKGVAGQNGPIVLEFANVPKDASGAPNGNPGTSSGCKTAATPEEQAAITRIRRNPPGYYVNMHTGPFPDGAVRGQLAPVFYNNGS
jgi:hypothetical protein